MTPLYDKIYFAASQKLNLVSRLYCWATSTTVQCRKVIRCSLYTAFHYEWPGTDDEITARFCIDISLKLKKMLMLLLVFIVVAIVSEFVTSGTTVHNLL